MDPLRKRGEKKRSAILKELEKYPHSFQMRDIGLLKSKALENLRNHLEAGLQAGYSTSLQTASNGNLLAFVLFQLKVQLQEDPSAALKETEKVLKLEDQRNNLVSLANKAHMLTMLNKFEEADEAVDELKELQKTPGVDYGYLLVKAKAELASSYSRFGPRFNKDAIDAFQEVLPHAREPEVWMWKFSLAMTYRHALDLQHVPYVSHGQYAVTHRDALNLLSEIINSEPTVGEEAARRNLQANAHAEMALLLRLTWDKTAEYKLCAQVQTGPMSCCKKALALDNEDAHVLWKSGKIFRNFHDLPQAKVYLEKAVKRQPSSAAYHHLGLVFKAMATNLQHGKKKTRRGGKREQRRKKAMANNVKRLKLDSSSSATFGALCGDLRRPGSSSQSSGTERIKKAVKSPNNATQFDPRDPNVQQAIKHLETAVKFSAGENSRAAYDLALMHVATDDLDEALQMFSTIVLRQNGNIFTPPGMLECITSQEQMALIYKKKEDREHNETEKKKLTKKFERLLYDALSLLSDLYSTSVLRNIFGEVFQSPSSLLKAAEAPGLNEVKRQKTKAFIFSLMNSHKQSLAALRDIPEDARDAEYYKQMIEAYARSGKYTEAVAVISSCLKPTQQYSEVMELLYEEKGKLFVFNMYLEAGKEALLDGPYKASYFTTVFRQAVQSGDHQAGGDCSMLPSQGATAKDADSSESGPGELWDRGTATSGDDSASSQRATAMNTESSKPGYEDPWDVLLLHDDEDDDIEGKAATLGNILQAACGLRVIRRDENNKLGNDEAKGIENNIENSRLVVVLPGKKGSLVEFDRFVRYAAMKESVVLLTEGIGPETIPRELKTRRLMTCPSELFAPGIDADGPYTQQFIDAVCRLFKFLANLD